MTLAHYGPSGTPASRQVAGPNVKQGPVVRRSVPLDGRSIAWAIERPVLGTIFDRASRIETRISAQGGELNLALGTRLTEAWHLDDRGELAAFALANELIGWVDTHGLLGSPRLTVMYAQPYLWIAVLDRGTTTPKFFSDPAECLKSVRIQKFALHWGVRVRPENAERATWGYMYANGRPPR